MLPLRTLRSRLVFVREDAQASAPQGSGPAAAEAQGRLQSWGSQMDLSAEEETGAALSLPSPDRFSASFQGWEACTAVSSAPIEAQTLQLSDSEELDAQVRVCGRTIISHGTCWLYFLLMNFLADLRSHHVLVYSDNTSVVSYINYQGGLQSRPLANWHAKSSCDTKGSCCLCKQLTSRRSTI